MRRRFTLILIGLFWTTTANSWPLPEAELSLAAMNGNFSTVERLIKEGFDVNTSQGDGTTALHWAASRNDLRMTLLLLEAGAEVKAQTRLGRITPLFMAAQSGNAEIIQALLESGADSASASGIGTTPLMLAAASGSAESIDALVNAGSDVNARDANQGQTALMFAAARGRAEVINVLAKSGANLDAKSNVMTQARDPKGSSSDKNKGSKVLALGGMSALHFAAREGHLDALRELVEAGADVNSQTASDKMSTLTLAIINGQFDMAKYLLEKGADPSTASIEGTTALFAALDTRWAARGWYPTPKLNNEDMGYLELMKMLVHHGANINARMNGRMWMRIVGPSGGPTYEGDTSFMRAAQANDVEAMRFLLSNGANPSITTSTGVNALMLAAGWGDKPSEGRRINPEARLASVRFLVEEAGLDVNSTDEDGFTPMHGAALVGDKEVILYLVANGADVATRANVFASQYSLNGNEKAPGAGETIADVANGPLEKTLIFTDVIDLLVEFGSDFSNNCRAALCINKPRGN